jgi:hypothetical protein
MENTTRISDLPENITMQMQPNNYPQNAMTHINNEKKLDPNLNTNYVPINVHPNPYGISPQNPIMPIPQPQYQEQPTNPQMQQIQQVEQMSQMAAIQRQNMISEQQKQELQNMQHMRLPSRDIPIQTNNYTNDEQVQPNYIPKPKLSEDFLEDYEKKFDERLRKHEEKKYRENRMDDILTEFQTPLLIVVLFFLFQLPMINRMIFKKFSFLSIYSEDGNFNFYGLLFKSILFGSIYYLTQKILKFISEF